MKRVMTNEGEILRIENGRYFILNEKWGCMQEVDLERFKKAVKLYENLCTNTWSKDLKNQYKELIKEVN